MDGHAQLLQWSSWMGEELEIWIQGRNWWLAIGNCLEVTFNVHGKSCRAECGTASIPSKHWKSSWKYDVIFSCSIKPNKGWGLAGLGTGPALQIGGIAPLEHCHRTSFRSGADKEMLKCAVPERSSCCWGLFEHVRSNRTLGEQQWELVIAGLNCWLEPFIAERSSWGELKQGALRSHSWELPQIKKLRWEAAVMSIITWKLQSYSSSSIFLAGGNVGDMVLHIYRNDEQLTRLTKILFEIFK